MSRFVKKKAISSTGNSDPLDLGNCPLLIRYPALSEYLALDEYPDGTKRVTSTLLLFVEESELKCCLNDRDQSRTCFVTGQTLSEMLDHLEAGLCDENLQWRRAKGKGRRN